MGFLDSIKNAAKAVTGGAARVTLEYAQTTAFAGDTIAVRVTATSTGGEVKSQGVFIDVEGMEVTKQNATSGQATRPVLDEATVTTLEQSFQIARDFVLAPNESKVFEGSFQLPPGLQPSYQGRNARHEWRLRGRMEATGNDPDSGFQPIRIGLR